MVVYAKSNGETLEEHTNELLNLLKELKSTRDSDISNRIPSKYRDSFWHLLELACKFHDTGKLHICFQNSMLKRLKQPLLLNNNNVKDIPHNLLSPSFMMYEISKIQDKNIQNCLLAAVAFSHSRRIEEFTLDDRDWKTVIESINNDLAKRSDELKDFSNQFGITLSNPPQSNYLRRIQQWKDYEIKTDEEIFYLFLKGFLHKLDYSASGGTKIEIPYQSTDNTATVKNYLIHEKNVPIEAIWQENLAISNRGKNVVLQAGTGSGKTEFSLFWAGNRKCFYTLPVRTSVNAMYERIRKTYNSSNVGLLHSDALFYIYGRSKVNNTNEDLEEYSLKDVYNSRQLAMPINISTADQLFTAVLKYPGFEKIYSTLAYSTLVVDEIQSYDPDMVAVILKGLRDIAMIGGNFCLMTATLPKLYLERIKNELNDIGRPLEILPERFSKENRHKIKVCEYSITESLNLIKDLSKSHQKVLVIVNTVKIAQDLFSLLDDGSIEVSLLHSGFIQKDRNNKEQGHKGILTKEASGIWITTQLVEVSVDIDFPVLVTELSTIDSLIQRMGRVRRHTKEPYVSEQPNVYVCIKEPSGVGTIYDTSLSEYSKEILKSYDGKLISPFDEHKMIQEVFGSKEFEESDYSKKFEKSWALLKLGFDVTSKNEAQRLFRKMASYTFIPSNIYDDNEIEIQKWIDEIEEKGKSFEKKIEPLSKLKELTVSINSHKVKGNFVEEELGKTGFNRGNLEYNPKLGISTKAGLLGIF